MAHYLVASTIHVSLKTSTSPYSTVNDNSSLIDVRRSVFERPSNLFTCSDRLPTAHYFPPIACCHQQLSHLGFPHYSTLTFARYRVPTESCRAQVSHNHRPPTTACRFRLIYLLQLQIVIQIKFFITCTPLFGLSPSPVPQMAQKKISQDCSSWPSQRSPSL